MKGNREKRSSLSREARKDGWKERGMIEEENGKVKGRGRGRGDEGGVTRKENQEKVEAEGERDEEGRGGR